MPSSLNLSEEDYSLLTDLYQLTMTACYVGEGIDDKPASFEMFARRLPDNFGYLIAMGLAQVLDYLENIRFSKTQIAALRDTNIFNNAPEAFWSLLQSASFTGDVWAVAEGTAIFPYEPILRIEAPLWQAQLVETYILNAINYQTLIATKAARIRDVAGKSAQILEFGTRRAFSPQAALWAARAAIAAGFDSTSNVLAAVRLGCKPSGTMAHALVMAIDAVEGSEDEAFAAFGRYFPNSPLLIDTYDTLEAAKRLARQGNKVAGVRIDSGDLVSLSQQIKALLPETKIIASGDLDEYEIDRLLKNKAVIDGYGIGTKLVTGAPVNGVYKLVEIDGIPTMKKTSQKVSYPSKKQVFRQVENGTIVRDRLGLVENLPANRASDSSEKGLLELVMQQGKRVKEIENLEEIKRRTIASVAMLPINCRRIDRPETIALDIAPDLQNLIDSLQSSDVESP
jgi:nicotinate phosphoribosyltransferase